jgi:hypothetical protein
MKSETSRGSHVGERWEVVEEQDQACPLPEVRRCGSSVEEASSLGEELLREGGAMKRRRARHETTPRAIGRRVFSDDPPSIGRLQRLLTLPLFVKWTT